jgi:hypothetical protein
VIPASVAVRAENEARTLAECEAFVAENEGAHWVKPAPEPKQKRSRRHDWRLSQTQAQRQQLDMFKGDAAPPALQLIKGGKAA